MKTQKQNEPQLSAEMEKRFNKVFDGDIFLLPFGTTQLQGRSGNDRFWTVGMAINPTDIKHFLATALEEQRAEILNEVENWLDIAPSMTLTNPANNNPANAFKLIDKAEIRAKLAQMKGKE